MDWTAFSTNRRGLFDDDERDLFFIKKSEHPGGRVLTLATEGGRRNWPSAL